MPLTKEQIKEIDRKNGTRIRLNSEYVQLTESMTAVYDLKRIWSGEVKPSKAIPDMLEKFFDYKDFDHHKEVSDLFYKAKIKGINSFLNTKFIESRITDHGFESYFIQVIHSQVDGKDVVRFDATKILIKKESEKDAG